MTTLRDLLNDFFDQVYEKGKEAGLGNTDDEKEMIKEELVDEYIESIKDRFVG